MALTYLALGLDPKRATLFRQSDVPEVTELTWLLMTVTPMHLLEKCHAYKDKKAKGLPADAGLFTYPVLMAADILLYDSDLVPVGADQVQHIEVTRDIAQRFNGIYGEVLDFAQCARRGGHGQGAGDRRRKDVQELRQHDRHLRGPEKAPQKNHVDQDRFDSRRRTQRPGPLLHLRPLHALCDAGTSRRPWPSATVPAEWVMARRNRRSTTRRSPILPSPVPAANNSRPTRPRSTTS